jgi:hypothetical protein
MLHQFWTFNTDGQCAGLKIQKTQIVTERVHHIGGNMAQIFVQTEKLYREQQKACHCGCWGPCTCPQFIYVDQLVDVLNSAAVNGSDNRHYVVLEEK